MNFARCGAVSARVIIVVFGSFCSGIAADDANADDWRERDLLTGDWGGARTALKQKGVAVGIAYMGETLGVLSGGQQQGISYLGRLDVAVDADLELLAGWTGGKAHVRALQIHSAGRTAHDFIGGFADPSNINALPTTRLYTAWFEQDFVGLASLRAGQLAADDEFVVAPTSAGLMGGTFGWSTAMGANLPGGGPGYPLPTPAVRLKVNPSETVSLLAAVFSGNPAGSNCSSLPQICNPHGTTFSLSGGAFWMAEAQYLVNQGPDATGLTGAYKIGGWHHTGDFLDQHFGTSLADNVTTRTGDGFKALHRHDWGFYGVIDQMLWRGTGKSASAFVRVAVAPVDRNLVSWYVDGGIGFRGFLPGRPDDTLTFGFAHAHISKDAAALDRDVAAHLGTPYPIRRAETLFELSYMAQLTPWCIVQPDVQYIMSPAGGVPAPNDRTRRVGDAFVIGARTTLSF